MSTSLAILELVKNITTSIADCKSAVGRYICIALKRLFKLIQNWIIMV